MHACWTVLPHGAPPRSSVSASVSPPLPSRTSCMTEAPPAPLPVSSSLPLVEKEQINRTNKTGFLVHACVNISSSVLIVRAPAKVFHIFPEQLWQQPATALVPTGACQTKKKKDKKTKRQWPWSTWQRCNPACRDFPWNAPFQLLSGILCGWNIHEEFSSSACRQKTEMELRCTDFQVLIFSPGLQWSSLTSVIIKRLCRTAENGIISAWLSVSQSFVGPLTRFKWNNNEARWSQRGEPTHGWVGWWWWGITNLEMYQCWEKVSRANEKRNRLFSLMPS